MFQYKSNDTNYTQYNEVLVVQFIRSKFVLNARAPSATVSPEGENPTTLSLNGQL
jgi:hypothetical protein